MAYAAHGMIVRDAAVLRGVKGTSGKFGRMFPTVQRPDVAPFPDDLGLKGGPMDGGQGADLDAKQSNPKIPSGFVFLAQFIDHDITLDTATLMQRHRDPDAVTDFRTPAFDLDCVYGSGPAAQPFLYDGSSGKLIITKYGPKALDLQRTAPSTNQTTAIIGDPRNDENLIVSQIQAAVISFHNHLIDEKNDFDHAQQLTRFHYQWIVLHEFLPLICGQAAVDAALKKRHFYVPKPDQEPFIPVEFSVAAYRFGHSQVRSEYKINPGFSVPLFPDDPFAKTDTDLRGGRPIPAARSVHWPFFFAGLGENPTPSNKIDTKLNTHLLSLPDTVVGGIPGNDRKRSLAVRNLERALDFSLPSGQQVARAVEMALPKGSALSDDEIWKGLPFKGKPAPLWFYLLREAELRSNGEKLGPVGALLIAEVLIGLLQHDPLSYLNANPGFQPMSKPFGMADFLKFAQVT